MRFFCTLSGLGFWLGFGVLGLLLGLWGLGCRVLEQLPMAKNQMEVQVASDIETELTYGFGLCWLQGLVDEM